MNQNQMKNNLKKLLYHYKFLKLELDDVREGHSILAGEFETLFSDIIPKQDVESVIDESKPKPKPDDESLKKVYKDLAKKLHPDKGGDEDRFKKIVDDYQSNNLLGLIDTAVESGVEVTLSDDDEKKLEKIIEETKKKIEHYKTTLAYVWKNGNKLQRYQVLSTLGMYLGKPINVENLSDDIKKYLE